MPPSHATAYARRRAMGTYFEVFLAGDDAEHLDAVAAAALDEITRLEGVLSRFDSRGEVARVNREAPHRPVRVDVEVWDVLRTCLDYRRRTGGYFDVTATSAAGGGEELLLLDEARRTVRFGRPGVAIDLGGFGKGYALDRAGEIVRHFGVASALLHGGTSSILAVGCHPDGQPWPIAVRDPFAGEERAAVAQVPLADQGFSCSAVLAPGQMRSDVLDPHRGEPLTEQAACVVVAPTAAEAEILSTALLAMGKSRAQGYLDGSDTPGVKVGWVERPDGRPQFAWLKEVP